MYLYNVQCTKLSLLKKTAKSETLEIPLCSFLSLNIFHTGNPVLCFICILTLLLAEHERKDSSKSVYMFICVYMCV